MSNLSKKVETATESTVKSNILQADPVLLSVIAEIYKCQRLVKDSVNQIALEGNKVIAMDWFDEFISNTALAIGVVGDLITMQIMSESEKLYCHE